MAKISGGGRVAGSGGLQNGQNAHGVISGGAKESVKAKINILAIASAAVYFGNR